MSWLLLGCGLVVAWLWLVVAWLWLGCGLVVAWLWLGYGWVVAGLLLGCGLVVAWLWLGYGMVVANMICKHHASGGRAQHTRGKNSYQLQVLTQVHSMQNHTGKNIRRANTCEQALSYS